MILKQFQNFVYCELCEHCIKPCLCILVDTVFYTKYNACTNFLNQEVLTSTLSDLEVPGLTLESPEMLHSMALNRSFRNAKVKK